MLDKFVGIGLVIPVIRVNRLAHLSGMQQPQFYTEAFQQLKVDVAILSTPGQVWQDDVEHFGCLRTIT